MLSVHVPGLLSGCDLSLQVQIVLDGLCVHLTLYTQHTLRINGIVPRYFDISRETMPFQVYSF